MLFIKRERPEIYRNTFKFLDVLDYVNFRLTGRYVTTCDSVVARWVTDNRDPERIVYHDGLIRASTIDRDKFPDICRSIDVLGPLQARVVDELGLKREVQVVAGAFDIPAAAIGSGALSNYAAHIYLGTSSWIAVHLPFKKTDLFSTMASLPCAMPDRFLLMAAQETAGGNLTWLRDNLLYHDDALLRAQKPGDFFAALNEVAAHTPAGSHGLIFTPWLYGERAPVDDGWIRAGIHNLSLENTRSDIVRAVMEGVAFNTRWILEPVEKFCGRAMGAINMIGGGA
ncbi:MAG: xylulose kinase, partial [Chloroflexi bacterium]|nr:xylulose kinase [Chloroflexota bacterium]